MASQSNYGKELLSWEIGQYASAARRGMLWYILAIAAGVWLLFYAISNRNFLFAFIVIMFAVIMVTHALRPARRYRFAITESGIGIEGRFYHWKDIANFWLAYEPPEVKMLYFEFNGLRPRLPVPLEDIDPNEVRKLLLKSLVEDVSKTEEPLSDWFARVFKI